MPDGNTECRSGTNRRALRFETLRDEEIGQYAYESAFCSTDTGLAVVQNVHSFQIGECGRSSDVRHKIVKFSYSILMYWLIVFYHLMVTAAGTHHRNHLCSTCFIDVRVTLKTKPNQI